MHAEIEALYQQHLYQSTSAPTVAIGTWLACRHCAKSLIDAGIRRAITHTRMWRFADEVHPRWSEEVRQGVEMMLEAGIEFAGSADLSDLAATPILINGVWFTP
jgi:deoxycytidylate deaminase